MTSTEIKLGLTCSARPSSRVLKPPGGGHSNIFAEPELSVNAPRPKHNQQNSSNLNACIGSTDPNQVVEKLREEIEQTKQEEAIAAKQAQSQTTNAKNTNGNNTNNNNNEQPTTRVRVPPGGFSSGGFW